MHNILRQLEGSNLTEVFFQNSKMFGYSFMESDLIFMYLSFINKNPIILIPLKIVILNFTMYILTISTCSLKMYDIGKMFL